MDELSDTISCGMMRKIISITAGLLACLGLARRRKEFPNMGLLWLDDWVCSNIVEVYVVKAPFVDAYFNSSKLQEFFPHKFCGFSYFSIYLVNPLFARNSSK
jgi:hypothetical protein